MALEAVHFYEISHLDDVPENTSLALYATGSPPKDVDLGRNSFKIPKFSVIGDRGNDMNLMQSSDQRKRAVKENSIRSFNAASKFPIDFVTLRPLGGQAIMNFMEMEEANLTTFAGGLKLPIGFRFSPTNKELIVHYLMRKVQGLPLPASVIDEFDVFQTEPYGLPGALKEKMYFFGIRKENAQRVRRRRVAGSGYWKSTGKDKKIIDSETNQLVGICKTMIFCEAKRHHNIRTRWIMHELSLVDSGMTNTNPDQVTNDEMEDWVVYRIFQKKIRRKKRGTRYQHSEERLQQTLEEIKPCVIDFTLEYFDSDECPPPPSPLDQDN